MVLFRSVSEINGDFSRKSQIFLTPVYFAEGFPLELGIGAWGQNARVMGLPDGRSLTESSAMWIQFANVTDGQTDRQTPDDSKDRAYAPRRAVKSPKLP